MDIKQLLAIDKVFFENTVPAAKSAGDEVWLQTQAAITYRTMIVDARLTGGIDISGNARLIDTLKQLVCLEAMADTVAERDLILTANGFGIVSNSNLAPASRERTEAFKASLDRSASARMDDAIEMLRATDGWDETRPAHVLVSSAVFLTRHLDFAGIARPTREDIRRNRPAITEAEEVLRMVIGSEQWEAFIAALRHTPITPAAFATYHVRVLHYIGAHVARLNPHTMRALLRGLLVFVEQHPDEFAIYHASTHHEANNFDNYANAKDDPTYFFG